MRLWVIELFLLLASILLIVGRYLFNRRQMQNKKEIDYFNKRNLKDRDLQIAINELNKEFPSSDISIEQFLINEKNKTT